MDLLDGPKLVPGEAVAALLVTPDGRYLLQHRDELPGIFFPGWWGTFGGAIEPGETPEAALVRELDEELTFKPLTSKPFCRLGLDFGFAGHGLLPRHYYEVEIAPDAPDAMVLGEGQGMALWSARQVFESARIIPYDATAIWQHASRHRF